jgi:hypothetical protein
VKVVAFAPHAGIWVHAFPEALVADAVRSDGMELVYVTCNGALRDYCVPIAAGVTCAECRRNHERLRNSFEFPGYDLDSVLDDRDRMRVAAIVDDAKQADIANLIVDGVAVGRAALYEFVIERKKLQLALTDDEWVAFRPRLVATLRSMIAAGKILDAEQPDRVLVYNSLYSANAVWRAQADARGIAVYFEHGGLSLVDRLQRLVVGRDSTLAWWTRIVETWPSYRDVPCSATELGEVTEHFLRLFLGTSVFAYSAPKSKTAEDVRGRFGVRSDQQLLVASMSSYDEYVAAAAVGGVPSESELLFPTQIEWIRALVGWMREHPERFLLIRVHPREFPNKRESLKSEHAAALERELTALPPNVAVNWPTDKLSIYDVAEQADVFLNAWSSAGKEMALLGLPVVIYCPNVIQYPAELNYVGTTTPAYFAAIESALRDGWSFERVRLAYRWCVLEFVRGLVSIADAFDASEDPPTSVMQRARNAALALPGMRQRHDLARRPRRFAAQARLAETIRSGAATLLEPPWQRTTDAAETAALRVELAKLVRALYGDAVATPTPGSLRAHLTANTD